MQGKPDINVAYFTRKPQAGHFSIEFLFRGVAREMPKPFKILWRQLPHFSTGIIPRIRSLFWVRSRQGHINHIVGDIHFISLALQPRKTVLTIHDCGFVNKKRGLAKWLLKTFWIDIPVRRARYVTTISEWTKKELLSLTDCEPSRIKVVHNFVTDDFFPLREKPVNRTFRILHVGTKRNKNLLGLIEALKGLDCELIIIGQLNPLQKEALKVANINFVNQMDVAIDDLVALYQTSDLLAFASLEEGFGLPILEAQKCGTPVMTANVTAMPEIAGEGALYVDPFDPADIRSCILKVMNSHELREEMRNKGFENVKRFTLELTVDGYAQIYRQITKDHVGA